MGAVVVGSGCGADQAVESTSSVQQEAPSNPGAPTPPEAADGIRGEAAGRSAGEVDRPAPIEPDTIADAVRGASLAEQMSHPVCGPEMRTWDASVRDCTVCLPGFAEVSGNDAWTRCVPSVACDDGACPDQPAAFVFARPDAPAGDGSQAAPMNDLQAAIDLAARRGGIVVAAAGTFEGAVRIADGVSIYGGYTAQADGRLSWTRDGARTAIVSEDASDRVVVAVDAVDIERPTILDRIEAAAYAPEAAAPGTSLYGIRALRASALILRESSVETGDAVDGADGADGVAGAHGETGGDATREAGEDAVCAPNAAPGAAGGNSACSGANGGEGGGGRGAHQTDAPTASEGGACAGNRRGTACDGEHGRAGDAGDEGVLPIGLGTELDADGFWTRSGGAGDDGSRGEVGVGGGGAMGDFGVVGMTTAGGGGGAAGCGGEAGRGGQAGGGAFGLFVVDSDGIVLEAVSARPGNGGLGGRGGRGGEGGLGAEGGLGIACRGVSSAQGTCDVVCSADTDAAGGQGGDGGLGGAGGPGVDGPAVGVWCDGSRIAVRGDSDLQAGETGSLLSGRFGCVD
jgi:hypothetical protein